MCLLIKYQKLSIQTYQTPNSKMSPEATSTQVCQGNQPVRCGGVLHRICLHGPLRSNFNTKWLIYPFQSTWAMGSAGSHCSPWHGVHTLGQCSEMFPSTEMFTLCQGEEQQKWVNESRVLNYSSGDHTGKFNGTFLCICLADLLEVSCRVKGDTILLPPFNVYISILSG